MYKLDFVFLVAALSLIVGGIAVNALARFLELRDWQEEIVLFKEECIKTKNTEKVKIIKDRFNKTVYCLFDDSGKVSVSTYERGFQ